MGMCDPYMSELVARAGFDWVLIDGEHAPNDIKSITQQLQVVEPHAAPVVRLPMTEPWLIKQALDAGVQSLLAPMINSAEEARAVVRAMRYPPAGIRGVGFPLGRASYFNEVDEYAATADSEMCLIVQIETKAGYDNLEDILSVEGVDAAFVGPADLGADMGFVHDLSHPQVASVVADALQRIKAAGKPAGIIDVSDAAIELHRKHGASFIAVGADVVILSETLRALSAKWKTKFEQKN